MNVYLFGASATIVGMIGICVYGYQKVFGEKKYKVLKDYQYYDTRIQLIKNPQNNICPHCFDLLEENEEICRFHHCDHHFCEKCIHKLVESSQSNLKNLKTIHPCSMCIEQKL